MSLYYIYSDFSGHDSIAVKFKDQEKIRIPTRQYRKNVVYRWTGRSYLAESREDALEAYYDE